MLVNEDITTLNNGYKLIQKKDGFRFSVDAVILSDFFSPTKKGKILDIGCGNGIIPILLYSKGKGEDITGVEIQEENCELALKNVKLNNLEEYIKIENDDVKEYPKGNTFDYIISNPPYMEVDGKKQNILSCKSIARHELTLNLYDLIRNAKRLLKPVGSITLVHRSYRFTDISRILEDCGFSLKRVRFVYYSKDRNSNLVLVEAFKGKKCKLEIEPPLFLEECGY
ncbi:tRNA1(Val) (adenine(37)-N6)-methyltransferase [uncultured Fusobacterium sp.]|jgi:tRNA1Val (adenine37-N6)-methyltransferase|uniref:tRNA1(Val) (adenine(37)-N6)-methyltransferase n=1 Tax=uncultured Fusobacterium sp. TaxID=159267 RepID=UPI0025D3AEFE|nr:tRNA1(Val) (adenine(37)-N6)-methyltransferase [uncultured Fusobacterium sp.]